MSLCTLADLQQFGQVAFDDPADPAVLLYISAATTAIEGWCGRRFAHEADRVEVLDGPGQPHLYPKLWPIHSVASVVEDGQALTEDEDYLVYPRRLTRVWGGTTLVDTEWPWTNKRKAITVTYTAGYDDAVAGAEVPDDLRWVCANVALRLFKAEAAAASTPAGAVGPVTSISLDGVGTKGFAGVANTAQAAQGSQVLGGSSPALTAAEKQALSRYRARRIAGSARPQGRY